MERLLTAATTQTWVQRTPRSALAVSGKSDVRGVLASYRGTDIPHEFDERLKEIKARQQQVQEEQRQQAAKPRGFASFVRIAVRERSVRRAPASQRCVC